MSFHPENYLDGVRFESVDLEWALVAVVSAVAFVIVTVAVAVVVVVGWDWD